MDIVRAIVRDPKVWSAVILLASLIARYVFPAVPADVWNAIVGLIVVVLAAAGVQGVVVEARRLRAMKTPAG